MTKTLSIENYDGGFPAVQVPETGEYANAQTGTSGAGIEELFVQPLADRTDYLAPRVGAHRRAYYNDTDSTVNLQLTIWEVYFNPDGVLSGDRQWNLSSGSGYLNYVEVYNKDDTYRINLYANGSLLQDLLWDPAGLEPCGVALAWDSSAELWKPVKWYYAPVSLSNAELSSPTLSGNIQLGNVATVTFGLGNTVILGTCTVTIGSSNVVGKVLPGIDAGSDSPHTLDTVDAGTVIWASLSGNRVIALGGSPRNGERVTLINLDTSSYIAISGVTGPSHWTGEIMNSTGYVWRATFVYAGASSSLTEGWYVESLDLVP